MLEQMVLIDEQVGKSACHCERRLQAVARLGRQALRSGDVPALMNAAVEQVADAMGVELVGLFELDPTQRVLTLRAACGYAPSAVGRTHVAVEPSVLAVGPALAEPLIRNRLSGAAPGPIEAGLLRQLGAVSTACVPVGSRGQIFGVLEVASRTERVFSRDDVHFLSSIAVLVGGALDRQRGEEALRQSEAEFRQAQKMEAVGRLAGGVAHDFNNLLSVINGYSELVADCLPEGDERRTQLELVQSAGKRATALTRQLLAMSRKQTLSPVVLDINTLVNESMRMLGRLVGEDLELVARPAAEACAVRADPDQLQQVLMNLVVNARDAMPGGGMLALETRHVTLPAEETPLYKGVPAGRYAVLCVRDSGCGMSPEVIEHVFEPFFTTKDIGHGTGLGLSTVFGIVTQSGGVVRVESEPGRGSAFHVLLPAVEWMAAAGTVSTALASAPRGVETVLLVEDEGELRSMTRRILERFGYRVLEAASGGDALVLCESILGQVDLVLTDVVMPHMSGCQLLRRLRKLKPTLRGLLCSGYTEHPLLDESVVNGAVPFLRKPFTGEHLLESVRAALDAPLES